MDCFSTPRAANSRVAHSATETSIILARSVSEDSGECRLNDAAGQYGPVSHPSMNRSKPVSLACAFWGCTALYFAAKGLNESAQGNAWERAFPRKTRKISRERRSSGRSCHELYESSPVGGRPFPGQAVTR